KVSSFWHGRRDAHIVMAGNVGSAGKDCSRILEDSIRQLLKRIRVSVPRLEREILWRGKSRQEVLLQQFSQSIICEVKAFLRKLQSFFTPDNVHYRLPQVANRPV